MEWVKVPLRDENGEGIDAIKCGDLLMPGIFARVDPNKRLQLIKDKEYKEGDVLLCTYPKVGTHWMTNILEFMCSEGPIEEMSSVSPHLMELMPTESWPLIEKARVLSSHLPIDRLPVSYFQNGGKIIIVVRNPKDAMVSMYFHLQKAMLFESKMSWNHFFELYSSGEVPYGSYFDYYDNWEKKLKECKTADFLVVHFEKLKKDGLTELKKIQEFLNMEHSDERLQQILDKLTIKKLQDAVSSGKVKSVLVDKSGKSTLYRKGEIGDWKNHFTVAQNERYNKILKERFKDSMFNFEYV